MNNSQHNRYLFEGALEKVQTNEKILTNHIVNEYELKEEVQNLHEVLGTLLSLGLGAAVAAPVVHTVLDVMRHRKEKKAAAEKEAQKQANIDRDSALRTRELEGREQQAAEANRTRRQATTTDLLQRRKEMQQRRRENKKARQHALDLANRKLQIELAKKGVAPPPPPAKKRKP